MIDEVRLDLPVRAALPSLGAALAEHGTAVLIAPPGTGKTTLVPLALAGEVEGRVLVAEPRRVAVRAAAARMASLVGERVGERVGYAIRGERKPGSRVEVVTTGLLVARLQRDPELGGVDAVILDECHERHLDTDLALAFAVDARVLRPDLRLLATSATAASDRLATLLDGPVVTAPDPLHPVDVVWSPPARPVPPPRGMRVEPALLDHVGATTRRALTEADGDVLVFLPGRREIDEVARRIGGVDAEVLTLHGGLDAAHQDAVLAGASHRRVVLATAIAETSLTVPGVRVVVDAGLSRRPWTDHARGLDALVTVLASQSSATQRAGRAGREAPGVVYRCWSEAEHAHRDRDDAPELAQADLAGFALQLARWGTPDGSGLALPDPPPTTAFATARGLLHGLGLVDDGGITDRGRAVATAGVHPRLGRALLDGAAAVGERTAVEVVALLAAEVPGDSDDLAERLRTVRSRDDARWRAEVRRLRPTLSERHTRHAEGAHEVPDVPLGEIDRSGSARPIRERHTRHADGGREVPDVPLGETEAPAAVVALAYPDRIARARGQDAREFLTTGGTGVELAAGSRLRGQEWIVVADAVRGPGDRVAKVRLAVPVDDALARWAAAHLHADDEVVAWEDGDVVAERRERLGAIVLARRPLTSPSREAVAAAVRTGLQEEGPDLLRWTDEATSLRRRLAFLHAARGEPWPAVDDASLLARTDEWLDLSRVRRRADLGRTTPHLTALLPWQEAGRLDELAPTHVTTPAGRRVRVDYTEPDQPTVALKLQHAFGWEHAPVLAGVPVVVHLLSPAGRPAAVTADLASFWGEGYRQVRADLRGRYPKHAWPEDPRA
ncbi:ATP-dependent helicase HrpB [Actinomycetospora termitidis]|uniref:ATP-dependent helicase HrpB n=1 Tax=Actinomycetospora termitidis TaxID=3053470 RepID=A0ABT7M9J0_9PSEU|nr:ATP-dependent helicase HrpB [Actinomycetospora sp. Odt1-22]MDL5157278.1 ATP-dependent helicase HrpB [Actinomycetospora sp. Odt1-22]